MSIAPNGEWRRIHQRHGTTEDVINPALDEYHLETFSMAKTKLESLSKALRDFSSVTMAIDPEKLYEFKTLIREFREKAAKFSQTKKRSEVFRLAVHFYPITQIEEKEENSEN